MTSLIGIILNKFINKFRFAINTFGTNRKCYICGGTLNYFTKYKNGSAGRSEFRNRLNMVGSDVDNFGCPYCGCHDRERHLFMFFDKMGMWRKMNGAKLLHFAPEKNLQKKIAEQSPLEYTKADLCPRNKDVEKIDATNIHYCDKTFDFIIANHILEHIEDYTKALCEFYRVLKPEGIAILQTPYSKVLKNNFEDENINTDELRLFFHSEKDHVRTFGEFQFLSSLENAGFTLQVKKHSDLFDDHLAYYYGVNSKEDLIQVVRSN